MDALDVAKVCLRRWYVVLPIVLLSIGAGLSLSSSRPSSYAGTAALALVYTQTSEIQPNRPDPRSQNPMAGTGGPGLLQEALVADLSSPTTQRVLAAPGLTPTVPGVADGPQLTQGSSYSVGVPQNSSSIVVSAAGANPSAVQETLERVLRAAPARAAAIQTRVGAPKASQYTTIITATPQTITIPAPSGLKLLVAIVGVGALAAAGMALLVERVVARRKARRAAENSSSTDALPSGDPKPEPKTTEPTTTEPKPAGTAPIATPAAAEGVVEPSDHKVALPQPSS